MRISCSPAAFRRFFQRLFQHSLKASPLITCLALSCAQAVWAQAVWAQTPDAGRSIRDLESTIPAPPPARAPAPLDVRPPDPVTPPRSDDVTTVLVQGFALDGNHVYSNATLLALLADLIGSHQDLNGLRAAAARITAHYHRGGYPLARAYLPAQDVADGVIRIGVLEGVYGDIVVNNAARVRDGLLASTLDTLRAGHAVHAAELDSALLRLNDIPGVTARGTLRAGAAPGSTDLVINAEPGPWVSGSLDADNYGGAYTGEYRLSAAASINSPLALGDALDVRLLASDGRQRYYHVDYSLPVGPWPLRLGAGASNMHYALGREFSALNAHGSAQTTTLYLRHALLRSRSANVQASVQYEHKRFGDNYDAVGLQQVHRLGVWTAAVNAGLSDALLGGGRNSAYVGYSRGNLRFGTPALRQDDRRFKQAGGGFGVVHTSLSRLQHIAGPLQLYGRLRAQWSSKNLYSSEKFSLGGPYGVRAFAPGAVSGDEGWQASAELRYLPLPGLQFSAFVDTGAVQTNKRRWSSDRNRQALTAFGAGVTHAGSNHLINVSAAWPLRQHMPRAKTDQEPRFWVQATRYF